MEGKTMAVVAAFQGAGCADEFNRAERAARRLTPHQQLLVIDDLRAAEARLNLGRWARKERP
jgi:hypothetical protein